jgi:hypothetical protein
MSNSDYGLPRDSRSGLFHEYIQQRTYIEPQQNRYPASAIGGHGTMAQTSSPSVSMPNSHQPNGYTLNNVQPEGDVPIDHPRARSSSTYQPPNNYSPYPLQLGMSPDVGESMHYGRPNWAGHCQQPICRHALATSDDAAPGTPGYTMPRLPPIGDAQDQGGHPLSTMYSFVPVPRPQQPERRPRRRHEEIERMYKCGWNGCEKAYGTLNHLNAHVTMQAHGTKRTPEGKNAIFRLSLR